MILKKLIQNPMPKQKEALNSASFFNHDQENMVLWITETQEP